MRDNIFNKPTDLIDFCFNNEVVKVFDDMVVRSVPGYKNILEFIKLSSKIYAKENTNLYDLGCSTGATSVAFPNVGKIIAVDNSESMLKKARQNLAYIKHIDFVCSDIENINIRNASVVVLNLTLQFIDKSKRDALIQSIYDGLNTGGILIISEKVHFENPQQQEFFTKLHLEFKKSNGYSDLEIANKRELLDDVLITDSVSIHLKRLRLCQFSKVEIVMQHLNFYTFIAIK